MDSVGSTWADNGPLRCSGPSADLWAHGSAVSPTTGYTPLFCSKLAVAEGDCRPRALGSFRGHGDLLFLHLSILPWTCLTVPSAPSSLLPLTLVCLYPFFLYEKPVVALPLPLFPITSQVMIPTVMSLQAVFSHGM